MPLPPPWAHDPPTLQAPDPTWPTQARRESAALTPLLTPWLTHPIEHIGSTSVPGLPAKPVLDLMASVTDKRAVPPLPGWHEVPADLDARPWRRFFVKPDATGAHRFAHLHVMDAGTPRWREQLAFRDALRADPEPVAEYAALKRRLAAEHPDDREACTEGKGEFVARVLGN